MQAQGLKSKIEELCRANVRHVVSVRVTISNGRMDKSEQLEKVRCDASELFVGYCDLSGGDEYNH